MIFRAPPSSIKKKEGCEYCPRILLCKHSYEFTGMFACPYDGKMVSNHSQGDRGGYFSRHDHNGSYKDTPVTMASIKILRLSWCKGDILVVMVTIGCHAYHSNHKNIPLLFLRSHIRVKNFHQVCFPHVFRLPILWTSVQFLFHQTVVNCPLIDGLLQIIFEYKHVNY